MRRIASTVALAFAALALVACAPAAGLAGPTPSETATPSPSPSETPTPTPDPVVPAEIAVSGTGFAIIDSVGTTTFTFGWSDAPGPAVTALTDAFGTAPVATTTPGNGTFLAPYDVYTWAGFVFEAAQLTDAARDYYLAARVTMTAADAHGISLTAPHGLAVGDPIADALAVTPHFQMPTDGTTSIVLVDPEFPAKLAAFETYLATGTVPAGDDPFTTRAVAVRTSAGPAIEDIVAPEYSYLPF
ncbi:hypothetical protein ARHIZOSPH14_25860 [Agromyces rhizosphaerae]|uniref:Uncharacterized protein n=1 Tax=Agromyces rhizosphaerae TaxID=88374 RepID=A0A9W6CZX5_9MICO|nr:hypothetical protein [Agromyces rhizosphaerae]GLI28344.1 hypothetical protein ARHIZOSPH14_25860 [Agromyces rhizosphaerae]